MLQWKIVFYIDFTWYFQIKKFDKHRGVCYNFHIEELFELVAVYG